MTDAIYCGTLGLWEEQLLSSRFIGHYFWTDAKLDAYPQIRVAYGVHLPDGQILAAMSPANPEGDPGVERILWAYYYRDGVWKGFAMARQQEILATHFADLLMETIL